MIQSMTGFFNQDIPWKLECGKTILLSFEGKSLNSRFFELSTKLPPLISGQENVLLGLFKQSLVRGKVFISIRAQSEDISLEQVKFSRPLVKSYLEIMKELEALTGQKMELRAAEWLMLPKVVSFDNSVVSAKDWEVFFEIARNWILQLKNDRLREGALIKYDLEKILKNILDLQAIVVSVSSEINAAYRSKLEDHKKLLEQIKEDEHHYSFEHKRFVDLEYQVDKSDVNEEIMRAGMHIDSIKAMFSSNDMEIGKKLEFTLQELLRETNTVGSKINDYKVNSACVEIKVEVEKLREQSQNIV